MLKNVEIKGHETLRTVADCVVKLRELREALIAKNNEPLPLVDDSDESCAGGDTDDSKRTNLFKADSCHVKLLKLCKCRSASGCTCVPDDRIKDTIFYQRDDKYDAVTIAGCSSMYAYRFLPRRKYIVHIRQYACETCPGCTASRSNQDRYKNCVNLNTIKATGYRGPRFREAMQSELCRTTGWVEHRIVPVTTSSISTTRGTDGLTHNDHRSRLKYIGKLQPGDNVFMANTAAGNAGEFKPCHFWVAQLLPPTVESQSVIWKTRIDLPPDCPAGSYCCKE